MEEQQSATYLLHDSIAGAQCRWAGIFMTEKLASQGNGSLIRLVIVCHVTELPHNTAWHKEPDFGAKQIAYLFF